jgi:hypothetical protein
MKKLAKVDSMIAIALCLLSVALAAAPPPPQLWLESQYSVSGISSGAFMAVQMGTIFSQRVAGVASFAGGPFYCTRGNSLLYQSQCMSVPTLFGNLADHVDELADLVRGFANASEIDAVSNIAAQRYFFFSGTQDRIVDQAVSRVAANVSAALGVPEAAIKRVYNLSAGHTFPTLKTGSTCSSSSSPYIGNCNFAGAQSALDWIVPGGVPNPPVAAADLSLLTKVDQLAFVADGKSASDSDLAAEAFFVCASRMRDARQAVPTACRVSRLRDDWHDVSQGRWLRRGRAEQRPRRALSADQRRGHKCADELLGLDRLVHRQQILHAFRLAVRCNCTHGRRSEQWSANRNHHGRNVDHDVGAGRIVDDRNGNGDGDGNGNGNGGDSVAAGHGIGIDFDNNCDLDRNVGDRHGVVCGCGCDVDVNARCCLFFGGAGPVVMTTREFLKGFGACFGHNAVLFTAAFVSDSLSLSRRSARSATLSTRR